MWGTKKPSRPNPLRVAIREAIQTEKNAMDFYRHAAERMVNDKARLTFRLLASEEREHARSFYVIYPGDDLEAFETLINAPPDTDSDWWQALDRSSLGGFSEKMALTLALEKERELELRLRATAEKIDDPRAREVYLANARATHQHLQVIEEDFANLLAALDQ